MDLRARYERWARLRTFLLNSIGFDQSLSWLGPPAGPPNRILVIEWTPDADEVVLPGQRSPFPYPYPVKEYVKPTGT
jgi:hypothetical protein